MAAREYVVSTQSADAGDVRPDGADQRGDVLHRRDRAERGGRARLRPRFTASRIGGPLEARTVELNPGFGSFQSVGFAGRRLVYVSGGRAHTAELLEGKRDIFDRSSWTHRRGPAMVYYDLDNGPRGLWLVHELRRGPDDVVVVRRWRRGRFGAARAIPGSTGNVIGTAIAQDAKGRLAVAWYDSRGDRIRVAASRNRRRWSRRAPWAAAPASR